MASTDVTTAGISLDEVVAEMNYIARALHQDLDPVEDGKRYTTRLLAVMAVYLKEIARHKIPEKVQRDYIDIATATVSRYWSQPSN